MINQTQAGCKRGSSGFLTFRDECFELQIVYFVSGWHRLSLTGIIATDFILVLPTIALNFFIIHVIRKHPSLQTTSNLLLSGLAISDLLIGLTLEPCKALSMIFVLNCTSVCGLFAIAFQLGYYLATVSFLILTLVSIDRYMALTYPFNYQRFTTTNAFVCRTMIATWVVPVVIIIFSIAAGKARVLSFMFAILAPLSIAISITAQICTVKAVRNVRVRDATLSVSERSDNNVRKRRRKYISEKATKVAGLVLIAMIACYAPHSILTAIRMFQEDKFAFQGIIDWTRTLVLFNSTLNPIIYCWILKGIRVRIIETIFKSSIRNHGIESNVTRFTQVVRLRSLAKETGVSS